MPKILFTIFCLVLSHTLSAQPPAKASPGRMPDSLFLPELNRQAALYRLDSAELAEYDKIITFDREVYVGKIHNITFSEVRITLPHDSQLTAIARSRVSQILYADGRRDVFIALDDRTVRQTELVDTARIIIKNQKDWMKVRITENPAEVNGLLARGDLKVTYEADIGNVTNEELMRHAGNLLRKKAASLKAHYVLVESRFFHKSYGDLPKVEVVAKAFGY
jgi:hypothetical protein